MIDSNSERAYHRQVADALRSEIGAGTYVPGTRLPSVPKLARQYGCGVDTIRAAVHDLENEGLVIVHMREGTEVTGTEPQTVVYERGPVQISARMPSEPERRERGLPPGVPLIVIERPADSDDTPPQIREYPGHTTAVEIIG